MCRRRWQCSLMSTCVFEKKSWWNISGFKSRKTKTTSLCSRSAWTPDPICSPGWIMPSVIQTRSNWGDSHLHHEQTRGNRCKKKYMYLQALCFWFLTQENNEPGYRAGNFTDFIQSQVPSFKSLVMQITTLSSSSVWFLSSGSITAIYTAPCLHGVLLVWIFFLYIK